MPHDADPVLAAAAYLLADSAESGHLDLGMADELLDMMRRRGAVALCLSRGVAVDCRAAQRLLGDPTGYDGLRYYPRDQLTCFRGIPWPDEGACVVLGGAWTGGGPASGGGG